MWTVSVFYNVAEFDIQVLIKVRISTYCIFCRLVHDLI